MDIEKMTRKQFDALPMIEWNSPDICVDSLVLLPTRKHFGNGFNYYTIIPCQKGKPLGKIEYYDTHSIWTCGNFERIGIDCLSKSGLMRIFLAPDKYVMQTYSHQTIAKDCKYYHEIKGE